MVPFSGHPVKLLFMRALKGVWILWPILYAQLLRVFRHIFPVTFRFRRVCERSMILVQRSVEPSPAIWKRKSWWNDVVPRNRCIAWAALYSPRKIRRNEHGRNNTIITKIYYKNVRNMPDKIFKMSMLISRPNHRLNLKQSFKLQKQTCHATDVDVRFFGLH